MAERKPGRKRRPRSGSGARATRHLVHAFASPWVIEREGPLTLVRGRGVHVWDAAGRRYIDAVSSLWNANVGHGRREIARAVRTQMERLSYAPTLLGLSSPPAQELAARIARRAPNGLSRVFFTCGGSEANESVIRLSRAYWRLRNQPRRTGIVVLSQAYHGSTTGAASLTGLPTFHRLYEPLMGGVTRVPRPYCYRCELRLRYPECGLACAEEVGRAIERVGPDRVGLFLAEPVQGVGGVIVPPPGYLQRVREICDRYDVLFAADEVITGFGRLGRWFGVQRWGVTPDMLVFAKGVTSAHLPLGGVILHERIYRVLRDAGPEFTLHHGFTYSGHPVSCAAGLANMEVLEREGLIPRVRRLEPVLARALQPLLEEPVVGEVRTCGLMAAVDIVRDRRARRPFPPDLAIPAHMRRVCLEKGVLVRATAERIVLCPPFVISPQQIGTVAEVLGHAIRVVQDRLVREGVLRAGRQIPATRSAGRVGKKATGGPKATGG